MKVVQVVVHRLDVVQNVADSVLVVAGCVVVEQSVADSALVVVQNVADSALRVVLECVCRPLRDTGVQLLAYTGGGDQLVGAFQSRADADLGLQRGSIYTVSAPILLTNHILRTLFLRLCY